MLLQPNTQLGPYRIIGLLGEGGMGEVYSAEDTRLGRNVAIKILTSLVSQDPEQLKRFAQEARAAGMLNHPNLITIFDIGTAKGMPFIVSELLEGNTMRDRISQGALSVRRAVDYALQTVSGLAAAHEKGIVHRDLKPENIFITRDDRVKILDFGIAKLNLPSSGEGPTFKMAATEPGMVLGTVGYMSPEQVRGENVDQRSDIFSFGAILYELLSGNRAFRRGSSIETLSAILKEEPPDLSLTIPTLPLPVQKVVERCLEKDRTRRFQSARDLAFHLDTLAHSSTGGSTAHPPVGAVEPASPESIERLTTLRRPANPPLSHPRGQTAVRPVPNNPSVAVPPPISRHPQRLPPRVSRALLGLLAVVSVVGAALGGYHLATYQRAGEKELEFHRITFRRGEVRSARFAPDGDTIVYSASWDGRPMELFVANRRSPEARALGIADAEIASVSKASELALLLHRDRQTGLGTLARVPIAGGTPREIAANAIQADWAPDGDNFAVIRLVNGEYRVEYPLGKVLYRSAHPLRELRISPSGAKVAFIEPRGGAYDIVVSEGGATQALAHGFSHGVVGLAWSKDEKELWFTGTNSGAPPALYAIDFDGTTRMISRLTGSMRLYDVSAAGLVLMMHSTWRASLAYQAPGEVAEHDASWLDWSIVSDLSADGKTLLFNETREGGGSGGAIYIRHSDSSTPVRIGEGFGDAMSPDARWVLTHRGQKLILTPTGTGEPRELKVDGSFDLGAAWMPDGKAIVLAGAPRSGKYGLYALDVQSNALTAVTHDEVWGDAFRPFAISPTGEVVAGMNAQQQLTLFPVQKGLPMSIAAAEKGEIPISFSADGSQIYVARTSGVPLRVFRITLASGQRELWKELVPADPAGVYRIAPIVMSRDGSSYAYNTLRNLSDLYVVEGLH